MDLIHQREVQIGKMARSPTKVAALQKHLHGIVRGKAFKGSLRSAQFLEYIVHQAIAGNFESLKERLIGVELFGRDPSYDTGQDAIVRVTANDVRKRLRQHYKLNGLASDIHIGIPSGSYIPEIVWDHANGTDSSDALGEDQDFEVMIADAAGVHQYSAASGSADAMESAATSPAFIGSETIHSEGSSKRRWLSPVSLLSVTNLVLVGILVFGFRWQHSSHTGVPEAPGLPWAAFFNSQHPLHLITSDPDISVIQNLDRTRISVSDYANHNYISSHSALTPELREICLKLLSGNKASTVDATIVANVSALAQKSSRTIYVQGARTVQFSTLRTDDNFIFLGSSRSDPWLSLFNDQLDFQFSAKKDLEGDIIRNLHPQRNELSEYVPTVKGLASGQSYAILAFVQNPDHEGQVLILAGVSAEGTEAAGEFATDIPQLSGALQRCGIDPHGPLRHFEFLLGVNLMAGSSSRFDVVACHILAPKL